MSTRLLVAALGLSIAACDTSKDDPVDYEDEEDTEDTTDPCAYREEPSPPSYDWSFSSMAIGSTTLRYYPTPSSIGLVVLFDGGGGSNTWFNHIEHRYQVEALVDAGYAVMALESEDPNDGNFDATDADTNPDIQNLTAATDAMQSLGVTTSPLYYLGFSSGGAFASLATRYIPANALVLSHVRGDPTTFEATYALPPPTLWVIGRNDPRTPPDDPVLLENQALIDAAGVDWEQSMNEPIGAGDGAFTRIADPAGAVTPEDSADLVDELHAASYLDACGVPVDASAALDLSIIPLGPSFTPEFADEAKRQFDELYGAHAFTSDYKAAIVSFFAAHPASSRN